jgi:hypothetical protein
MGNPIFGECIKFSLFPYLSTDEAHGYVMQKGKILSILQLC